MSSDFSGRTLESWLLSNYQAILDSREHRAITLANELNALFVEQSENLLSLEEFDFSIMQILQREESSVSYSLGQTFLRTEADSTVRKRLQIGGQVVDVHLTMTVG